MGAQIRAARALLGWRRADLATAAGLHRNAVAYWERRTRLPRREEVGCSRIATPFSPRVSSP
jgi:transcriptional regulator with XRE-family HTH domain